ncbi:portal protein [Ferrovibrio sp.]|uniref:portal protein n=1 Tax=Ferrovibrio sp. TaxID=1917215 RepID=UPI001B627176|nr:portal protein [Ferrovibrio sp.]MBP7062746.1 head-tail connector protein [Ferrovibrio sp.]
MLPSHSTEPTIAEKVQALRQRHAAAKAARSLWESRWQECYAMALPLAAGNSGTNQVNNAEALYDGTAADAVEQFAASLLAQLTPPWSRWFAFQPGSDMAPAQHGQAASLLDDAARRAQGHFDRSNFIVEIHQCYLDLITAGTACLAVEEAALGEPSALRFAAVPLLDVVLEEGGTGRLDSVFRRRQMKRAQLLERFPAAASLPALQQRNTGDADTPAFAVLEAVLPQPAQQGGGYAYTALLDDDTAIGADALLAEGRFARSPYIAFRWLKAPGEAYGRSPVMKALPDIKTANKVVELVLKNASIAVTGIWQADDDGVLNPANIKLLPGAIIPKAVGSSGLTPLAAPGRFDISQLVLDDLRARIRHAMLADRLDQVAGPKMSATEVLERAAEMARLLGASFGRLQGELLTPLLDRVVDILQRRGELPGFALDGRDVALAYQSPLARLQAQADVQSTLLWLEQVKALGPAAAGVLDAPAVARWLGRCLGVPGEFLLEAGELPVDVPLVSQQNIS